MRQFLESLVDSVLAVGILLLIPVAALHPSTPLVMAMLAFVGLGTVRYLMERRNS